ncbi:hypothetical protein DXG01_007391 [Tephrocybe rancida]|nr:hypothetical protein DXG01_007391 [Tephrocybe rancida]
MAVNLRGVEALLFDVFGTVVDWRRTVEEELVTLATERNLTVTQPDWQADFAQEWRNGYLSTTRAIAGGSPGTSNVDEMHRQILDAMLDTPGSRWKFLAAALDVEQRSKLNRWPDSTPGLYELKKSFICATLSNGNVRLLVDMAKHADLPWDLVFSTELFGTFKPNPKAYLSAAHHLSLEPSRCAMVAAHIFDLRAAAAIGMRTVYIPRLGEEDQSIVVKSKAEGGEFDVVVQSLEDLASIFAAATERQGGSSQSHFPRSCLRTTKGQSALVQVQNAVGFSVLATSVARKRKRGPPKSYIERLEKRVEKLQELLSQISPEAIEHLNGPPASTASHPLPTPSQSTGEWAPYDPAPRRFIRHLGSSRSPSPPPDDDESTRYLKDDFERLHITANDPRYFGKSSGIKLIRDTLDLKNMCIGKDNTVPPEQTWSGIRRPLQWITPPALTVPTFTFPDPDLITSLIDLYFKHVNCYFPLLHRPTFERDVSSGLHHTNSAFAGTLILLCAVAARYSNDLRVMDDPKEPGEEPDPHSSGWKWFSQVPLVRATPLAPPCLYELQFFALVGQFLQASSVPQACWTIVGIGIRVAQDVGAHRRKSRGEHTVEDELWNRSCFDIEMPVECDDEYWEHPDPELRWRQPTPEKTPSKIVYFNVYIRLNQILAFLLRTVVRVFVSFKLFCMIIPAHIISEKYATNKSRILHGFGGQQWEENIVSELDSALNAWMATLPDHLRWDPSRPDEIYFNQSASLFCFYQHIQILVHRPFIPSPHQPNKALSFPSLAICTNAARACSNALDIQRKRYGTAPPPLTTTAFSAGVILLLGIWGGRRSGHLTESYDKEMHDVKKCMDVLKLAEVRDILRELAFVGDVPLPQRPSDSPPAMQKRERSLDGEESGDDVFTPPSQSDSNPRASGRFKKQPETLLKGVVSRRTLPETSQSLAQLQTLPEYDFEYHRPPQQALHSSLNPQQQWPRQGATQPAQKQYDNYIRPHAPLQMQHPNTLPGFGQVFGPTGYSEDVGAMSSFVVPRGSDTGPGLRHGYPYRAGTEAAGTLGMDVDMGIRQRTDMGLGMGQPGALGANDDQAFTLWSDVPPGFQYAQWDNYVANLDAQNTPRQGQYTPHG